MTTKESILKVNSISKSSILALATCLIGFIFWSNLLTFKYNNFGFSDWDFALYAQAMWNLCHGTTHTSLFGTSFLANHAHYFAFFLVPIYYVFQHPLTLIHLNLLSFFGGAFMFFIIIQKDLGWKISLLLMTLYILHPPNIYMLFYEFHFESLAIGLIFVLFYFFKEERFIPFIITAFFVALIKENMPFIIMMFGIYSLFSKKTGKIKWGLTPLFLGLLISATGLFIIMPFFRQHLATQSNVHLYAYSGFFSDPFTTFLQRLLTPENFVYLRNLFGANILLAPFSPHILFLGAPIFAQNILSSTPTFHSIQNHYAATVVPFIFLASASSLKAAFKIFEKQKIFILLTSVAVVSVPYILPHSRVWKDEVALWTNTHLNPVRKAYIHKIPSDAGVIATFGLLDQLSQRKNLIALYNVWENQNHFTGESPFNIPENITYALIDFLDPWFVGAIQNGHDSIQHNISRFFENTPWYVADATENVVLFQKNHPNRLKLVEQQETPFPLKNLSIHAKIDNAIELQFIEIQYDTKKSDLAHFVFHWKALNENLDHYKMYISLTQANKTVLDRPRDIGYLIYPTQTWEKDNYVREHYWMKLPNLKKGTYVLQLAFRNATKAKYVKVQMNKYPDNNSLTIGNITIE